jgi:hypothetical protein
MLAHFTDEDKHIVDVVMRQFQSQLDTSVSSILEERISELDQHLNSFEENLRSLAPLDYVISPAGKEIRTELQKLVPQLEEQARSLRLFFPLEVKREAEILMQATKTNDSKQDIGYIFNNAAKRKSSAITPGIKIKQEAGLKRVKAE